MLVRSVFNGADNVMSAHFISVTSFNYSTYISHSQVLTLLSISVSTKQQCSMHFGFLLSLTDDDHTDSGVKRGI